MFVAAPPATATPTPGATPSDAAAPARATTTPAAAEMWSTLYPGQASALAAQDEVVDEVGAEVILDSISEGDHLSRFFGGHDNSVILASPGPSLAFQMQRQDE